MKKIVSLFLLLLLVITISACRNQEEEAVNPEVLKVQLIPSRDATKLDASRKPLEDLLKAQLDMDIEVTIATDYNALIEAMKSERVHVGLLATTSYVLAADEGAAEVILKSLRFDVDDYGNELKDQPLVASYKAQLVAHKDSGITKIEDLKGKRVAISSFTSTSGFVWPANLLADKNLSPKNDVQWINAGGHDNALLAVVNGDADAAFTFKDARSLLVNEYPTIRETLVHIADTAEIPNDTISVIPRLDENLKNRIKQAFINIGQLEEGRRIVREIYSHEGYAEATDSEYNLVRTYLERQQSWGTF